MAGGQYMQISATDSSEAHHHQDGSHSPSFSSNITSPAPERRGTDPASMPLIDRALEETFDDSNAPELDGTAQDDREQLIRNSMSHQNNTATSSIATRSNASTGRVTAPHHARSAILSKSNDGVFANLNAKPEIGEKFEEQPPSYEQAAADATPPYWETTMLAPGMMSDEVFIDGLPVGSFFSFAWNGIVSMAFQLVGFLLTYLLHTTHAAKNGSRAGLGITLINYGFTMKSISAGKSESPDSLYRQPSHPDDHDFDPSSATSTAVSEMTQSSGQPHAHAGEWFSYGLMIIGWIVLIKAVTDFVKARRHEQLILQSPERAGAGTTTQVTEPYSIV